MQQHKLMAVKCTMGQSLCTLPTHMCIIRLPVGKKDFSFPQSTQKGSVAHPA